MSKFTLDTNLYVRTFRDRLAGEEMRVFFNAHTPQTYLCSVVLHELAVGMVSRESGAWVQEVAQPYEDVKRVITPSHTAWRTSGAVLSQLAIKNGIDRRRMPRSLVNDALIAATCRENGVTLVTDNVRDFALIRTVFRFEYVAPWPNGEAGS